VDCNGALSPLLNIDNTFMVSTDTIVNNDTITTKLILVDQEAPQSLISEHLTDDIIRAMAYQESNWHNYLNHYPLEHHQYTMTGMMQISRYWWENVFNATTERDYEPGFWEGTWDSLSWNWMAKLL